MKLQLKLKEIRLIEGWEHLTKNMRKTALNVFLFKKWTEKFSENQEKF